MKKSSILGLMISLLLCLESRSEDYDTRNGTKPTNTSRASTTITSGSGESPTFFLLLITEFVSYYFSFNTSTNIVKTAKLLFHCVHEDLSKNSH